MGLSVWRIILIILVIVCVVAAVLCHVIALFSDYWLKSSTPTQTNFLNIGLWRACFDHYQHKHEEDGPLYDGCHDLYSDYYMNIRDWLISCKIDVYFPFLSFTICINIID